VQLPCWGCVSWVAWDGIEAAEASGTKVSHKALTAQTCSRAGTDCCCLPACLFLRLPGNFPYISMEIAV